MKGHVLIKGLLEACAILFVLGLLASCSPRIVERVVVQHDTTRVVRIDSVWTYQHDSVFVREKGDTVYQYVEHIRYRDRIKIDTVLRVQIDSVTVEHVKEVPVEQPLSWWQSLKIGAFWWLLLAVVGLLVWTFRKLIF